MKPIINSVFSNTRVFGHCIYLWKHPVRIFGWLAEAVLVGVRKDGVGHRMFKIAGPDLIFGLDYTSRSGFAADGLLINRGYLWLTLPVEWKCQYEGSDGGSTAGVRRSFGWARIRLVWDYLGWSPTLRYYGKSFERHGPNIGIQPQELQPGKSAMTELFIVTSKIETWSFYVHADHLLVCECQTKRIAVTF
jgi:hypothetical protein